MAVTSVYLKTDQFMTNLCNLGGQVPRVTWSIPEVGNGYARSWGIRDRPIRNRTGTGTGSRSGSGPVLTGPRPRNHPVHVLCWCCCLMRKCKQLSAECHPREGERERAGAAGAERRQSRAGGPGRPARPGSSPVPGPSPDPLRRSHRSDVVGGSGGRLGRAGGTGARDRACPFPTSDWR